MTPTLTTASSPLPVQTISERNDVSDPFRWLEDQSSVATRAFLDQEQKRYAVYLNRHPALRLRIEKRVAELLEVESVDLPFPAKNGDLFYLKRPLRAERKDLFLLAKSGSERRLLCAEDFDQGLPASLAFVDLSPSGRYLVFAVRHGGADIQEIRFYDLLRDQLLADRLPLGLNRGIAFPKDESGVYYSIEDRESIYHSRHAVRFHLFGDDAEDACEVFHAGDGPSLRMILRPSTDGSALGYLIATLAHPGAIQFLVQALPIATGPQEVASLQSDAFSPSFTRKEVEAVTTHLAPLGRVVRFPSTVPNVDAWEDILPQEEELLRGYETGAGFRIAHYQGQLGIVTKVFTNDGTLLRTLRYPERGTTIPGRFDHANLRIFYSHSDVGEPASIYTVDIATGDRCTWWTATIPPSKIACATEERTCISRDGTEIPMTVVRPIGAPTGPAIVSAYGANGKIETPQYSALTTILLEEGFICVTAHVRGGGRRGIEWHHAGMKTRKQTSVEDLLAATEWLGKSGIAEPDRIAIAGQSTGALLALCAMVQRPGFFRAVVALGPLTDLTRFHLFGVARGFTSELGSPENPEEFPALYALSPYHHVHDEAHYPAVLLVSGDMDRRCDALHARKMAARLHQVEGPAYPVLLDYSPIRGHKAVMPLSERIRALTNRLTFLFIELGQAESEVHP